MSPACHVGMKRMREGRKEARGEERRRERAGQALQLFEIFCGEQTRSIVGLEEGETKSDGAPSGGRGSPQKINVSLCEVEALSSARLRLPSGFWGQVRPKWVVVVPLHPPLNSARPFLQLLVDKFERSYTAAAGSQGCVRNARCGSRASASELWRRLSPLPSCGRTTATGGVRKLLDACRLKRSRTEDILIVE